MKAAATAFALGLDGSACVDGAAAAPAHTAADVLNGVERPSYGVLSPTAADAPNAYTPPPAAAAAYGARGDEGVAGGGIMGAPPRTSIE